jgi:ABC-2 type transport system permease protein
MTAVAFAAFVAKEVRLQRRDPTALILLFFAPLLLIVFLSKALAGGAQAAGGLPATAAFGASEQASPYDASVPGFTVMFAFFAGGFLAMGFFRERMWGTWPRVLALPLGRRLVMLGKAVPVIGIVVVQGLVLLFGGALVFGIPVSSPAMVLVATLLVGLTASALGLVIVLVTRTDQQIQQLNNVIVLLMGALGGAMAPLESMPQWAQDLAPAVPQYWAVNLIKGAMAGDAPLGTMAVDAGVLLLFAIGLCAVALPWLERNLSVR